MSDTRSADYNEKRDEAATPPPLDPSGRITPVLQPNEARGGVTHHNVRMILAISLAGVIILMIAAYFLFFPTPEPLPPAQQTTPEAAMPAPPPDPVTVP